MLKPLLGRQDPEPVRGLVRDNRDVAVEENLPWTRIRERTTERVVPAGLLGWMLRPST